MKPKSFTYPCDVTLSISHHNIGEYKLTVNYSDPNSFGNDVVKFSSITNDIDFVNRTKFIEKNVGDKILMDDEAIIAANEKAIMKVLSENGMCCTAIKHTKTKHGVQYYFEQTVQTRMKDVIKNLFY